MEAPRQGDFQLRVRARRAYVPLIILMIISACLQVAGFVSPGWIIAKYDSSEVYAGLWLVHYCELGECHTKISDEYFRASIVLNGVIVGLISIISAIIAGGISLRHGRYKVTAFFVTFLSLISGILALVAAGNVANNTQKANDVWIQHNLHKVGDSPYKFPYSALFTGLGGILACITSVVSCNCVVPWTKGVESRPTYQLLAGPSVQFPIQQEPNDSENMGNFPNDLVPIVP